MTIKKRLQTSVVLAMREQNKARLSILRLIQAAIKQKEIDTRYLPTDSKIAKHEDLEVKGPIELDDVQCLELLDKMLKQRRESIQQFTIAHRQDLIDKESYEMQVIQEFLPLPLDEVELQKLIMQAIASTGAISVRDMNRVMTQLKPQIQGRADMAYVCQIVKDQLNS